MGIIMLLVAILYISILMFLFLYSALNLFSQGGEIKTTIYSLLLMLYSISMATISYKVLTGQ